MLLKEEEDLVLRATMESSPCASRKAELPAGARPLGAEPCAAGKTLIENDVKAVPTMGFMSKRAPACVFLWFPLGRRWAFWCWTATRARAFNANDMQSLESVADICATAIQNAHYVERVKHLAYLDGLTGIFNRRFFELRIEEEIERARRFGPGMAVIMVDIDQFKRLNDEFGHLLGDEVLRQVSSIFHQQLRKIDVVCRYGGEEFAILLSQTNQSHALGVAEKLRKMVEAWQFPGVPRPVTISAGTANSSDHGTTRDELVKAADAGLYAAKQAGRNRVCLAPAGPKTRDWLQSLRETNHVIRMSLDPSRSSCLQFSLDLPLMVPQLALYFAHLPPEFLCASLRLPGLPFDFWFSLVEFAIDGLFHLWLKMGHLRLQLAQLLAGRGIDFRQFHIHALAEKVRLLAFRQGQSEGLFLLFPNDADRDGIVLAGAHGMSKITAVMDGFSVDFDDHVAGAEAGFARRGCLSPLSAPERPCRSWRRRSLPVGE